MDPDVLSATPIFFNNLSKIASLEKLAKKCLECYHLIEKLNVPNYQTLESNKILLHYP